MTITTSMKPVTSLVSATLASTTSVITSVIMPLVSPTMYTPVANINSVSEPRTAGFYSPVGLQFQWQAETGSNMDTVVCGNIAVKELTLHVTYAIF